MVPLAEHFRIRLQDTRAIAPTRADRLTVIRSILDMARDMRLIGVGLVDTHAHGMVQCTHAEAMSLAHRITLSLHRRLSLPVHFEPSWVRPVENGSHGYNLFRYILTQNDHHGLDWDPLHEATNLPDLLGLRLIGGRNPAGGTGGAAPYPPV